MFEYVCMNEDVVFESLCDDLQDEAVGNIAQNRLSSNAWWQYNVLTTELHNSIRGLNCDDHSKFTLIFGADKEDELKKMITEFEKKQSKARVCDDNSGSAKRQRKIPERFDDDSDNTPVKTTEADLKVCCGN